MQESTEFMSLRGLGGDDGLPIGRVVSEFGDAISKGDTDPVTTTTVSVLSFEGFKRLVASRCSDRFEVGEVCGTVLTSVDEFEFGEVVSKGDTDPVTTATVTSFSLGVSLATGSSISMATDADFVLSKVSRSRCSSRRPAAVWMVSMVTSRARGVASLGVEAWLVSVS